ncbi:SWPV1-179 [Shearwaterpox virus]|uniref:SWPV1-179 n=1 Tax=Shearwaterpox virus TaxID=1974596 RepID=A0A1V0S800_CNPV|nr:SWPV1-179 [Shearwaterpox virus]
MDFRRIKRHVNDFFSIIRYGDFELSMINSNNYVNVSQLCYYSNKNFTKWMEARANDYIDLINILEKDMPDNKAIILINNHTEETNGYYVHPSLLPIIASWASPTFAINASKMVNDRMMNSSNNSSNCYIEMMNELNEKRLKEVRELKNHYREQKRELNLQNKVLRSKISELENKNGNMRNKINNFNSISKEIKDENSTIKNKIKITERLYIETIKENAKLIKLLSDLEKNNETLVKEIMELREKAAIEITELYNLTMRNNSNNLLESDDMYLMDSCFKKRRSDRIMKKHYLLIMQEKNNLFNFRYVHIHIRKVCLELYRSKDHDFIFYTCYEISSNALSRFKEFLESNDNINVDRCNFSITCNTYTILDLRKDINALLSK